MTNKCKGMVLVILDYNVGSLNTYKVHIPKGEDTTSWVEEFGEKQGHHMSDCEWMIGDKIIMNLDHYSCEKL